MYVDDKRPPKEPTHSPTGSSYYALWLVAERSWCKSPTARNSMKEAAGALRLSLPQPATIPVHNDASTVTAWAKEGPLSVVKEEVRQDTVAAARSATSGPTLFDRTAPSSANVESPTPPVVDRRSITEPSATRAFTPSSRPNAQPDHHSIPIETPVAIPPSDARKTAAEIAPLRQSPSEWSRVVKDLGSFFDLPAYERVWSTITRTTPKVQAANSIVSAARNEAQNAKQAAALGMTTAGKGGNGSEKIAELMGALKSKRNPTARDLLEILSQAEELFKRASRVVDAFRGVRQGLDEIARSRRSFRDEVKGKRGTQQTLWSKNLEAVDELCEGMDAAILAVGKLAGFWSGMALRLKTELPYVEAVADFVRAGGQIEAKAVDESVTLWVELQNAYNAYALGMDLSDVFDEDDE